jgi:hypothetical protein
MPWSSPPLISRIRSICSATIRSSPSAPWRRSRTSSFSPNWMRAGTPSPSFVKHMAGNMRSRWVDFLTTDGEKPDRNRDSEFVDPPATREALMRLWEESWGHVFHALEPLSDSDLGRTVMIRGEAHSVMQAINRQVAHYSMHIGTDRHAGEAFRARSVAITEYSAESVGGVQSESGGGREQSAVSFTRVPASARQPPDMPEDGGTPRAHFV